MLALEQRNNIVDSVIISARKFNNMKKTFKLTSSFEVQTKALFGLHQRLRRARLKSTNHQSHISEGFDILFRSKQNEIVYRNFTPGSALAHYVVNPQLCFFLSSLVVSSLHELIGYVLEMMCNCRETMGTNAAFFGCRQSFCCDTLRKN